MDAMDLIAAALAAPHTHKCVVTYKDGKVYSFGTRSEVTAQNHAMNFNRKIGRNLIDRATGKTVVIVSVEVLPL
jgi:hypothetical protein